jgi:glucoamylase
MSLDEWIQAETRFAAGAMMAAISATQLVMERPGFGQRVVPHPGSVLASPAIAHYDPEPDYFFHWFRDAAVAIDALRVALAAGYVGSEARGRLHEFVEFTLALRSLDGGAFFHDSNLPARVQPACREFLRSEADMAALRGNAVAADVRVNADGTPDFIRWSRPQADGPALRCIALLRWWGELPEPESSARGRLRELIDADLAFTVACSAQPCFDIWEEHHGFHYYTQLVQAQALRLGAGWLAESGELARARACEGVAATIEARLEALWSARDGFYCARAAATASDQRAPLDIAVILAVLHAGRRRGDHSLLDPRVHATLSALEELFARDYAINRALPPARAAAMGRYANDRYYSGGAYYFATLAAAEFYFKLAHALRGGAELAATEVNHRFLQRLEGAIAGAPHADGSRAGGPHAPEPCADGTHNAEQLATLAMQRGDAFLRTVQAFTPADGALSEQFDRTTGAQASARHLTWSYAAFVTAAASRAQALRTTRA